MKRFALVTVALWALAACGGSEKKTETAPLPPDTQTATDTTAEPAAPAPATPPAAEPGAAYQPTADDQAKLEQLTAVIVEMGNAAEANKDDCGALGNSLVQVNKDNQALFDWTDQLATDERKALWFDSQMSSNEDVIAATTQLKSAAQACQNDPAFRESMQQGGMM